ncbi:hypothetical protein M0802_013709 [Mischocyttarus mexicanus]|nr:hypothetical protein M0802_013715 [Mischocyttarus mexicanus]KAI4482442.1 hypothetical protein M0802_013709 [Mischocyttarus mexicanus]
MDGHRTKGGHDSWNPLESFERSLVERLYRARHILSDRFRKVEEKRSDGFTRLLAKTRGDVERALDGARIEREEGRKEEWIEEEVRWML